MTQVFDAFLDSLSSQKTKDQYKYHLNRFMKNVHEPITNDSVIAYLMKLK